MFKRFFAVCVAIVLAGSALAQSYTLRAGDQLSVEVLEDPSLNRQVLVLPGGDVTFPLAGTISASGKTVNQFQSDLAAALAPNFATAPSVFVAVNALAKSQGAGKGAGRMVDVYVMGEVSKPGMMEVKRGSTLLQVLAQSGGFTKFAATKRIQLRRVNPATGAYATYNFNYRALESGAQISGQTLISDGDVVIVPQRRLFE